MTVRVTDARHLQNYVIWVRFNDGSEGEIDLAAELDGPIFEPLKDLDYFAQLRVDPDIHTVVWPNGADFAPEFLHDHARVPA